MVLREHILVLKRDRRGYITGIEIGNGHFLKRDVGFRNYHNWKDQGRNGLLMAPLIRKKKVN